MTKFKRAVYFCYCNSSAVSILGTSWIALAAKCFDALKY